MNTLDSNPHSKICRCFFAIELSGELEQSTHRVIEKIKKQSSSKKIKWTAPEKLHMTLRFLGAISSDLFPELFAAIKKEFENYPSFEVDFKKFDLFPAHRPHILGMLFTLNDYIADIVKKLDHILEQINIEPEKRPFLPHITLARINGPVEMDLTKINLAEIPNLQVKGLTFFRSDLGPHGSVYTAVERFQFVGWGKFVTKFPPTKRS